MTHHDYAPSFDVYKSGIPEGWYELAPGVMTLDGDYFWDTFMRKWSPILISHLVPKIHSLMCIREADAQYKLKQELAQVERDEKLTELRVNEAEQILSTLKANRDRFRARKETLTKELSTRETKESAPSQDPRCVISLELLGITLDVRLRTDNIDDVLARIKQMPLLDLLALVKVKDVLDEHFILSRVGETTWAEWDDAIPLSDKE